nr:hypothetical protein [Massilia cavernae]
MQTAASKASASCPAAMSSYDMTRKSPAPAARAISTRPGTTSTPTMVACGDAPYRDGWREGSWAGFSSDFTDPPPWYFRTLESWIRLYSNHGFRLVEVREPVHPASGKPVSVILIGELRP